MSWLAALPTTHAAAQPGSLLVVSEADVPSALERVVKRKLSQVADVVAGRAVEGLAPCSEAALSKLGPRAGTELIVCLRLRPDAASELQVELRSGKTGAVRSTLELPLQAQGRRFKRPSRALRDLAESVHEALAHEGAVAARSDAPVYDEASTSSPEPAQPPAAVSSVREQSSGDEQVMADPELRERLETSSSEAEAGPRQGLGLQASVGVGPGSHALTIPSGANTSGQLETGVAPAVELSAAAELGLGQWLLRAEAQYRTFFGSSPAPVPSDASSVSGMTPSQSGEAPLTSHSFMIGASPGYRFAGKNSVALFLMLGWTYRSLHASVDALPSASLTGLIARPALYIPFGDGLFCLRLAPELIVVQSSETSAALTTVQASGGVGFGMEAAVDVKLAKLLAAGLQYRRSRVVAKRSPFDSAVDEEWYVSVQAVLSL